MYISCRNFTSQGSRSRDANYLKMPYTNVYGFWYIFCAMFDYSLYINLVFFLINTASEPSLYLWWFLWFLLLFLDILFSWPVCYCCFMLCYTGLMKCYIEILSGNSLCWRDVKYPKLSYITVDNFRDIQCNYSFQVWSFKFSDRRYL